MWLTPHKGATPVNYTSATDWQIVRRDNVISITLRRLLMSTFIIRSADSPSSSYPICSYEAGWTPFQT